MRYLFGFIGLIFAVVSAAYRHAIADTLGITELLALPVAFLIAFLPFVLIRGIGASDHEIDQSDSSGWLDWRREFGFHNEIRAQYFMGALAIALFQVYLLWKTFRHG